MKKLIKFLVFVLIMIQLVNVNAAEVTIGQVVDSFQNGTVAKQYQGANAVFEVTNDSDSIDIKIVMQGETTNVSLDLNGNIISASITDDSNSNEDFITMYMFLSLMDEVGVLHGYESGEISKALNSGLIDDYKLDTHGFEIVKVTDTQSIYKFDFTKKIELPSYDNIYLMPSDLEKWKEYLVDKDASFSVSRGNVIIYKTYGDLINFSICEKGELTSNTYNSIVSTVEVLFDNEDVVNYYKDNYPSLLGDKTFDGFVIKTDSTKFTEEDLEVLPYDPYNTLDGYVCSVIYVDTEAALEAAASQEEPEEEPAVSDEPTKTEEKDDDNNNLIIYIAIAAGVVVVIGIVAFIVVKGKKNKNKNNQPQTPVMPQANVNNSTATQINVQPIQPVVPTSPVSPTVVEPTSIETSSPVATVVSNDVAQEVPTTTNLSVSADENKVEEVNTVIETVCPSCGEKKVGKFCMKCGHKFE